MQSHGCCMPECASTYTCQPRRQPEKFQGAFKSAYLVKHGHWDPVWCEFLAFCCFCCGKYACKAFCSYFQFRHFNLKTTQTTFIVWYLYLLFCDPSFTMWDEAMGLRLLLDLRPTLGVFIEQPSSSWAYKLPFMVALFASFKIFVVTSYMGLFGHDLAKCSHLASNLRLGFLKLLSMVPRWSPRESMQRRWLMKWKTIKPLQGRWLRWPDAWKRSSVRKSSADSDKDRQREPTRRPSHTCMAAQNSMFGHFALKRTWWGSFRFHKRVRPLFFHTSNLQNHVLQK